MAAATFSALKKRCAGRETSRPCKVRTMHAAQGRPDRPPLFFLRKPIALAHGGPAIDYFTGAAILFLLVSRKVSYNRKDYPWAYGITTDSKSISAIRPRRRRRKKNGNAGKGPAEKQRFLPKRRPRFPVVIPPPQIDRFGSASKGSRLLAGSTKNRSW